MITAIKSKFDRKTKKYVVEVTRDADLLLIHSGHFLFDDPVRALAGVKSGDMLCAWSEPRREAVIAWLEGEVAAS